MIGTITILMDANKRAPEINEILHKNAEFILGRMGLPQTENHGYILSIVFKGEERVFEELLKDLKRVDNLKIAYSKI